MSSLTIAGSLLPLLIRLRLTQEIELLWRLFAKNDSLKPVALRALLSCALHVEITEEGMRQLVNDQPKVLHSAGALKVGSAHSNLLHQS